MTYQERQARWVELLAKVPDEGPYSHAEGNTKLQYLANRLGLQYQTLRKWQCNSIDCVRYPPPSVGRLNMLSSFIEMSKKIGW